MVLADCSRSVFSGREVAQVLVPEAPQSMPHAKRRPAQPSPSSIQTARPMSPPLNV